MRVAEHLRGISLLDDEDSPSVNLSILSALFCPIGVAVECVVDMRSRLESCGR